MFRVDSLLGMADAVVHGFGLGLLLVILVDRRRGLKRLGDPIAELDTQLWVLTHPDLRRVPRIQVFTDFLYEQLVQSEYLLVNEPVRRRLAIVGSDNLRRGAVKWTSLAPRDRTCCTHAWYARVMCRM